MRTRGTIRLATRGSALARKQAALIQSALEQHRYDVELVEVETTGDKISDELIHRLGKTGAFVRALDEQVLDGTVDGAIHSMKDMPTEQPDELIVAGIPERADPGDVLVTPDGRSLPDLPEGAVIGTASLRRKAQCLAARPDLTVEPIRGNVDTRIEKLLAPHRQREHQERLDAEEDGEDRFDRTLEEWFDGLAEIERLAMERQVDTEYDGIVLAAAGLERSGLGEAVPTVRFEPTDHVPAPGQGAIAVTAVDGSDASEAIHDAIDTPRTRVETTVERVVLAELGGGCIAPIGIYGVVQGEHVHTTVQVLNQDGTESVAATRDISIETYVEGAKSFAADLRDRGAAELIEIARREAGE